MTRKRTPRQPTRRERQGELVRRAQAAMIAQAQALGRRDAIAAEAADSERKTCLDALASLDSRLIAKVVARATPAEARLDSEIRKDLLQEGTLAYWRAVELYDPARGTAFSTLVWTTIYRTVRRYIEDHGYSIRVPGEQQKRMRRVIWHRDRLRAELGRNPSLSELAAATGLTQEQVRHLTHIPRVSVSLDDQYTEDGRDVAETVAADESDVSNPIVFLPRARLIELLHVALDGDTAGVVADTFGIAGEGGALTRDQIAEKRGLSRVEVGRMQTLGISTLCQPHYQAIARAWATDEEAGREPLTTEAAPAVLDSAPRTTARISASPVKVKTRKVGAEQLGLI